MKYWPFITLGVRMVRSLKVSVSFILPDMMSVARVVNLSFARDLSAKLSLVKSSMLERSRPSMSELNLSRELLCKMTSR